MTDSGDQTSARLQPQPTHKLFQLLLPSAHSRVAPKGASSVSDPHFHGKQQPYRPQTARRPDAVSDNGPPPGRLPLSPRFVACVSPASPLPRCRSAGVATVSPSRSRPLLSSSAQPQPQEATRPSFKRPLASTRTRPTDDNSSVATTLDVNPRAREHVEVKACMLAYMHRIDVDALQQLKERVQHEVERVQLQRFVTRSGLSGDGSEFDTMRRKTSFLLRHFFSLDDG